MRVGAMVLGAAVSACAVASAELYRRLRRAHVWWDGYANGWRDRTPVHMERPCAASEAELPSLELGVDAQPIRLVQVGPGSGIGAA